LFLWWIVGLQVMYTPIPRVPMRPQPTVRTPQPSLCLDRLCCERTVALPDGGGVFLSVHVLYGVVAPSDAEAAHARTLRVRPLRGKKHVYKDMAARRGPPPLRLCPLPRLGGLHAGLTVHVYDGSSCVSHVVPLQGRALARLAEGLGVPPAARHDLTTLARHIVDAADTLLRVTRVPFGGVPAAAPGPVVAAPTKATAAAAARGSASPERSRAGSPGKGSTRGRHTALPPPPSPPPPLAAVAVDLRLPTPPPLELTLLPAAPAPAPAPGPGPAPGPVEAPQREVLERQGKSSCVVGSGRRGRLANARGLLARERERQALLSEMLLLAAAGSRPGTADDSRPGSATS